LHEDEKRISDAYESFSSLKLIALQRQIQQKQRQLDKVTTLDSLEFCFNVNLSCGHTNSTQYGLIVLKVMCLLTAAAIASTAKLLEFLFSFLTSFSFLILLAYVVIVTPG